MGCSPLKHKQMLPSFCTSAYAVTAKTSRASEERHPAEACYNAAAQCGTQAPSCLKDPKQQGLLQGELSTLLGLEAEIFFFFFFPNEHSGLATN